MEFLICPPKQAVEILPYQLQVLRDESRFLALMWCRGARKTFTVTLKIVLDCLKHESLGKRTTWVILSRGERQAKEAIREAQRHCQAMLLAADIVPSIFTSADGKRLFSQHEINFPGGSRIIALPANPDTARGYSANAFLDEFSIHQEDQEIWRSLQPVLRGRFRVIVASTPKGGRSRKFHQIITDGSGLWSKSIVDVHTAVDQGLPLDIEVERQAMGDPEGWAQEFELQWLDDATSWLPLDLIYSCEDAAAGDPGAYQGGLCYLGNDIARRRDLWVLWVLERVGDVLWTREVVTLQRASFAEQDKSIAAAFKRYKVARLCLDQTGMGERAVEDYQRLYGASRVEGLVFTGPTKQALATLGRQAFEKRSQRIPDSPEIRDDFYKLKKSFTTAGNIRFDAERDEQGHADRAWSNFLALHAADGGRSPIEFESVKPRDSWEQSLGRRSPLAGY